MSRHEAAARARRSCVAQSVSSAARSRGWSSALAAATMLAVVRAHREERLVLEDGLQVARVDQRRGVGLEDGPVEREELGDVVAPGEPKLDCSQAAASRSIARRLAHDPLDEEDLLHERVRGQPLLRAELADDERVLAAVEVIDHGLEHVADAQEVLPVVVRRHADDLVEPVQLGERPNVQDQSRRCAWPRTRGR